MSTAAFLFESGSAPEVLGLLGNILTQPDALRLELVSTACRAAVRCSRTVLTFPPNKLMSTHRLPLACILSRYPATRLLDFSALDVPTTSALLCDVDAMFHMVDGKFCGPMRLEQIIVRPAFPHPVRVDLELRCGVAIVPALPYGVNALLAAASAYEWFQGADQVELVETEAILSGNAFLHTVQLTTPGGSVFGVRWEQEVDEIDEGDLRSKWIQEFQPGNTAASGSNDNVDTHNWEGDTAFAAFREEVIRQSFTARLHSDDPTYTFDDGRSVGPLFLLLEAAQLGGQFSILRRGKDYDLGCEEAASRAMGFPWGPSEGLRAFSPAEFPELYR